MRVARVDIHYRRPPDREQVYVQELLLDGPDVKVSFQPDTPVTRPAVVEGRTILEPGSPVVWFTFPGGWHDVGRFHLADGSFTGHYANILTPPRIQGPTDGIARWDTTDLFLDVWLAPGSEPRVLDRDQFDEARRLGWIGPDEARRALDEVEAILAAHARGAWPPAVADEWTLARARAALHAGRT